MTVTGPSLANLHVDSNFLFTSPGQISMFWLVTNTVEFGGDLFLSAFDKS